MSRRPTGANKRLRATLKSLHRVSRRKVEINHTQEIGPSPLFATALKMAMEKSKEQKDG